MVGLKLELRWCSVEDTHTHIAIQPNLLVTHLGYFIVWIRVSHHATLISIFIIRHGGVAKIQVVPDREKNEKSKAKGTE